MLNIYKILFHIIPKCSFDTNSPVKYTVGLLAVYTAEPGKGLLHVGHIFK